jgi:hypothetical protein
MGEGVLLESVTWLDEDVAEEEDGGVSFCGETGRVEWRLRSRMA